MHPSFSHAVDLTTCACSSFCVSRYGTCTRRQVEQPQPSLPPHRQQQRVLRRAAPSGGRRINSSPPYACRCRGSPTFFPPTSATQAAGATTNVRLASQTLSVNNIASSAYSANAAEFSWGVLNQTQQGACRLGRSPFSIGGEREIKVRHQQDQTAAASTLHYYYYCCCCSTYVRT